MVSDSCSDSARANNDRQEGEGQFSLSHFFSISEALHQVSISRTTSPASVGGLAAPQGGSLARAPAPQEGGRAGAKGAPACVPANGGGAAPSGPARAYRTLTREQLDRPLGEPLYPATGISTGITGDEYGSVLLTGTGEKTNSWCGEIRTTAVCSKHPEIHKFRAVAARTCRSLLCPSCWSYRAAELAETASARVWAYYEIQRQYRPRGVVFSVPPKEYHKLLQLSPKDREVALRHWGAKAAKAAGLQSFTVINHNLRILDEYQQWANDTTSRLNADNARGRSQVRKENRYTVVAKQDNWRSLVEFSPHVHVIGYGFLENAKTFYERTGIVYKVVNKGRPYMTRGDVARAVYYLLSHVSPVEGCQVVTYFGSLSYNRMVCVEETPREIVECCPDCGAPRVYADTGEYVTKRVSDRVFVLKATGQRSQTTDIRGQDSLFLYLGCEPPK